MKTDALIFLDIDGVLNRCEGRLKFTLEEQCLRNFASFVHKTQQMYSVQIFLTSSWRRGLANDLDPKASSPQMQMLLRKFDEYGIVLSGFTPISSRSSREVRRDDEIRRKIRQTGAEHYRVITIDDDAELYSDDCEDINLYLTDYKRGFTKQDIRRALKKLSSG